MNGRTIKGLAAALLLAIAAHPLPARAGAGTPGQPAGGTRVDLTNASAEGIRTHILDACVVRQWGVSTSSKDSYADRCACYAQRVTRALSDDELAAFRRSAVFNDSARPKAQAALAACKL